MQAADTELERLSTLIERAWWQGVEAVRGEGAVAS